MNFNGFETDRLTIKLIDKKDKLLLYNYRSLPEVYRYQSWFPESPDKAEEFITRFSVNNFEKEDWTQLGVYLKDDGLLIGDIGIHNCGGNIFEIGFTLSPQHQKKGYAFEAVTAVLDLIKNNLNPGKIIAYTDPQNFPSIHLLGKLGFSQKDHLRNNSFIRGEWVDDLVFEIQIELSA